MTQLFSKKTTIANKFFVIALTLLVANIFCSNVFAGNHSINFAVIDAERVLKESLAMTDIQNKVVKKQDEYQKEVNKKQNALEDEKKKIENKKNIVSKDKFTKEEQAFAKKVEDFKNYVEKRQGVLQKSSLEAVSKVNDVLKKVVSDIAKEKSLQMVISNSQVLFYEDAVDISAEVITRLNKAIDKVEVNFES
jgi:Skp family chaperone for outer membrane proteins